MKKIVEVAVGVIKRNKLYFMTKRLEHVHQGGKWEFPGGKVETNELPEYALNRELKEEVNIDVLSSSPLITINHDYGDKAVSLIVYLVENFSNEPKALEGQKEGWFTFEELLSLDLPDANKGILDALKSIDEAE
ncbi:8-oxo-dGTP diphosphatase MutT [Pseudocolwellia agarivorans]|uniref:8-oxo-dGTP diphosphatase MutT n=1 Tax=Pseudocolwellia agarivorans TaxID=1911682 RepID=UPI000984A379|nr:8-oxo-dGTP diphosphatase MutT [Pseudocolwellia agarivorans]